MLASRIGQGLGQEPVESDPTLPGRARRRPLLAADGVPDRVRAAR